MNKNHLVNQFKKAFGIPYSIQMIHTICFGIFQGIPCKHKHHITLLGIQMKCNTNSNNSIKVVDFIFGVPHSPYSSIRHSCKLDKLIVIPYSYINWVYFRLPAKYPKIKIYILHIIHSSYGCYGYFVFWRFRL